MPITPQGFHYQLSQIIDTENYLVAFSGGVDSHVLLHLCAQLKNAPSGSEQSFTAVYVDHGLSPHANQWGRHCQRICYELDIPLTIIEIDARPNKGQSPEAAARLARYNAFSEILQINECLLTAQHLNDQAETLLLQLLRGGGVKGLAAMPGLKTFSRGTLCRPMLHYRKTDILAYAKQHQLQWIEDESNDDEHFDRNFLRQSIIPLLQQRWPAVVDNVARTAELQAESQRLLEQMARKDMYEASVYNEHNIRETDQLLIKPLLTLKSRYGDIRQNNLLRYWISVNHIPLPSRKILQEIVNAVVYAGKNANPKVCWCRDDIHVQVRKYRNTLYLLNSPASAKQQDLQTHFLTQDHPLVFEGGRGTIVLEDGLANQPANPRSHAPGESRQLPAARNFDRQKLLSRPIRVAFRRGGERYRRSARDFSRPLKHWFQEQGIPPWERPCMPLIYWGDELIQVGEQVLNVELISSATENSLIIRWIINK